MPEFLALLPPGQALRLLMDALPARPIPSEEVEAVRALNRVTATPILAAQPLPAFSRSAVDGFAVRAADTFGASDSLPAYLSLAGEVPMGGSPPFTVPRAAAALIHTGGMLPDGADAVVMLEYTQAARPGEVEVLRAVAINENVVRAGEDVQAGDEVIPAGTRIRPAEIGGLMALGIRRLQVTRKPRIGIISSGDEVVPPEIEPGPGQVRDINSYSLGALVEQEGGEPAGFGIAPDNLEALRSKLGQALESCDCVVVTAGSSASTRDLTVQAIQEAGTPGVLVHGVNVRPGKPTILAVCAGKPVIGLPGNPVSALVIAGLFLTPVLGRLSGCRSTRPRGTVAATLSVNLASQAGREDWVPVSLVLTETGYRADPVFYKSNLIFSLVKADGLLHIPADATGLSAGDQAQVNLLS